MKAHVRFLRGLNGEPDQWQITPCPNTLDELDERKKLPPCYRFEAIRENAASLGQDITDWMARIVRAREAKDSG